MTYAKPSIERQALVGQLQVVKISIICICRDLNDCKCVGTN